jgi:cytoskeletal protein RodZ
VRCGARFHDDDVTEARRADDTGPSGGSTWQKPVAVVTVVCLLVLTAIFGVSRLQGDEPGAGGQVAPTASDSPTDGVTSDVPTTDEPSTDEPSTDEPSTDEPSTDEPSTDETTIDSPSDTPTTSQSGSATTPEPEPSGATVRVAAKAQGDPLAPYLVQLLTRYFDDINERRFDDWLGLFTPEAQARLAGKDVAAGYRSTFDSDAWLEAVEVSTDGRPVAVVSFTSVQDPQDGPDNLGCSRWLLRMFLEPDESGTGYLIGVAPTSYHARYVAC